TGRWAKPLAGVAAAGLLTAIVADALARSRDQEPGEVPELDPSDAPHLVPDPPEETSRRWRRVAKKVAGSAAMTAIAAAGYGAASTWAVQTSSKKFFERRILPDMGPGPLALGAAILGWDFIYY